MDLYRKTIELLHEQKGKHRQIAIESGLDYEWVSSVSRGRIQDPGVKKMERLYAHLESIKELEK